MNLNHDIPRAVVRTIALRRRSRLGRWLRIPHVFYQHFEINRRVGLKFWQNVRHSWSLTSLIF